MSDKAPGSELFWKLPQELILMIAVQRDTEAKRLESEAAKLRATSLEEVGELHFTPDSPRWPQVLELALATFPRAGLSWVALKWDPYKSNDAWKISTDRWDGYVWTPDVLKALGF